jgi:hypothetical protein
MRRRGRLWTKRPKENETPMWRAHIISYEMWRRVVRYKVSSVSVELAASILWLGGWWKWRWCRVVSQNIPDVSEVGREGRGDRGVANIKITLISIMTPRNLVKIYARYGGTCLQWASKCGPKLLGGGGREQKYRVFTTAGTQESAINLCPEPDLSSYLRSVSVRSFHHRHNKSLLFDRVPSLLCDPTLRQWFQSRDSSPFPPAKTYGCPCI